MQERRPERSLLTARQVQDLLHVDRSTVYRMAEDGRLPAIRVGSQWRFPADRIEALLRDPLAPTARIPSQPVTHDPAVRAHTPSSPVDASAAQAAVDVAADLLGVMMVVTDMAGEPLTDIANPCPWFAEHAADAGVMDGCLTEWRDLANLDDFQPRFLPSAAGFECARAFIRSGSLLVGMVLAGGLQPPGERRPGLYDLDPDQRRHVLDALPRIAGSLGKHALGSTGAATTQETR